MLDESARSAGKSRDELQRGGKGIENLRCVVARGYIHKNAPVPVKNCRAANCEYLSADTTSRRPPLLAILTNGPHRTDNSQSKFMNLAFEIISLPFYFSRKF